MSLRVDKTMLEFANTIYYMTGWPRSGGELHLQGRNWEDITL